MFEQKKLIKGIQFVVYFMLVILPIAMTTMTANATESKTTVFNLAILAIAVLLILRLHNEDGFDLRRTALDVPIIAYLAWTVLDASISHYRYATFPQMLRVLSYVILYFVMTHYFLKREYLKWLFVLAVLSSVPPCVYGIFQHFRIDPISWIPSSNERILATFGNPTYFAAYLAFTIPVTFAAYLMEERRDLRFTYLIILAMQQICILWTYSRGPWVGTMVAIAIAFGIPAFFHPKVMFRRFGTRVGVLFVVLVIATVAVSWHSGITQRAASTANIKDPANLQRVLQWKAAARVFRDHPIAGVGPGALKIYMPRNLTPAFFKTGIESVSEHAHNEFIEVAADTGIVGIALFIWILVQATLMVIHYSKRDQEDDYWGWLYSSTMLGGIVGLLICNLAGVTMRYSCGAVYFWLYLGLLASISSSVPRAVESEHYAWLEIRLPEVSRVMFTRILFVCTCIAIWFTVRPFMASMYEKDANEYISDGDAVKAEKAIMMTLSLSPDNTSVLYRLASIQTATGKYREGLDTYKQLQAISPDYGRIHYNLGAEYMNMGDPKQSVKEFEMAVAIDGMPDTWRALSNAYHAAGDEKKSAWALGRSLESDPAQGWRKRLELAEVLFKSNKIDKTEQLLKGIVRDNPELVKPRLELASAYERAGKQADALEIYKQVLKLQPNNVKAHANIGCIYFQMGKLMDAKEQFERAGKQGGGIAIDANLALVYFKLGNNKAAMKECEYVLKTDPDSDAANQARAIIYKITGEKRL